MGSKYRNETLRAFRKEGKLAQEEYRRLFEEKAGYSEEQELRFSQTLQKVIDLQAEAAQVSLEMVQFPHFEYRQFRFGTQPLSFAHAVFAHKSNFEEVVLAQEVSFEGAVFLDKAYFYDATFERKATFTSATFEQKVYFRRVKFLGEAYFLSTTFREKADFRDTVFAAEARFRGAVCKDLIQFSGALIARLDLETSRFDDASYLHLHGYDPQIQRSTLLSSRHFPNKESARHIKAHFEKQNNITEANKYFVIEQSLYLDELRSEDWWSHKGRIFTVALHKLISNSGTSWIKVLFWLLLFALTVLLLHDGIPQSREVLLNIPNRAVELINPMLIFKRDNTLYEGQDFWGMVVRVIAMYLIYQFMMAFRQDTRRK